MSKNSLDSSKTAWERLKQKNGYTSLYLSSLMLFELF